MAIGKFLVCIEDGFVVYKSDGFHYDISLGSIGNHLQLLEWVVHLSAKNWIDADLLGSFVQIVCREKGWNLFGKFFEQKDANMSTRKFMYVDTRFGLIDGIYNRDLEAKEMKDDVVALNSEYPGSNFVAVEIIDVDGVVADLSEFCYHNNHLDANFDHTVNALLARTPRAKCVVGCNANKEEIAKSLEEAENMASPMFYAMAHMLAERFVQEKDRAHLVRCIFTGLKCSLVPVLATRISERSRFAKLVDYFCGLFKK